MQQDIAATENSIQTCVHDSGMIHSQTELLSIFLILHHVNITHPLLSPFFPSLSSYPSCLFHSSLVKLFLTCLSVGIKNGVKGESGASDDELASDVLSHYSSASESTSVLEEGTGLYINVT